MTHRTVSQVVYAAEERMGPLTIRQPLPSERLPYLDPFVLLHHAPTRVMDGMHGVDSHPHKGFAPVSFVFKGGVRHRDSRGNDSTITAGGTQWMHAGSGILHEELPLAGEFELIQLWINSPARHKVDPPSYFPLTREQTPRYVSEDGRVTVSVIAGNVLNVTGPVPALTPINAATLDVKRGGRIVIPLPRTHNAFVYLLDGAVRVGADTTADGHHQIVFQNDGDTIEIEARDDTRVLLMSGEPIGEPIASGGPFVMNSEAEIRQAFREYRHGVLR
jgi:redox-sensitive bicupin YhaK (pirin superfamily)